MAQRVQRELKALLAAQRAQPEPKEQLAHKEQLAAKGQLALVLREPLG
jgi:hypothetical protein